MINGVRAENDSDHAIIWLWGFVHKALTLMMKDWAQSTGLATMAVGSDGEYISGCYNFTDLCLKFIRNSPEGMRRCVECDRKGSGIYFCHAGLVDFAVPITLEDGTMLGTVLGGQVLPERPDEERFRAGARDLGLDEDAYIDALRRVNIRTSEEIKASADLLSNVINMFVRTSYAARENAASLSERAEIISSLGSIYFSDYYIDLDKDQMLELDATDELRAFVDCRLGASRLLDSLCRYLAVPDHFAEFLEFTDLSTLRSRLGSRQSIAHDFICRDSGWCRAVFITANRGEGGRVSHVIFALQHIQEEKEKELRVQQALRDSADRANRANKAKSDFLSRMSHDIRTPINGIIGMAYLAGREDNPPKTKDCLAKIDSSSKFLLGLINDILDMTKAESDKIELHPEPYPPQEFHEYLDAVFMPLFRDKRQKFLLDSHPVKGRVPVMDKLHINQVVFNLLSNASCRQGDYWPRIPASRYFDGKLVSWSVGLVKPQPEIYYKLCATFGLKMDECVFIDDDNGNIEGAFFSGMHGIVFHGDVSILRRDLRAAGVYVKAE